jgi:hypothetical protein
MRVSATEQKPHPCLLSPGIDAHTAGTDTTQRHGDLQPVWVMIFRLDLFAFEGFGGVWTRFLHGCFLRFLGGFAGWDSAIGQDFVQQYSFPAWTTHPGERCQDVNSIIKRFRKNEKYVRHNPRKDGVPLAYQIIGSIWINWIHF